MCRVFNLRATSGKDMWKLRILVSPFSFLMMQLGMHLSPTGTEDLSGEGDVVFFAKLRLLLLSTFSFPPWFAVPGG